MTPPPPVPSHISDDIQNIADLQREFGSTVTRHQRAIEALTGWLGRPRTLYTLLAAVAFWIIMNLSLQNRGRGVVDGPPFFWLQGALTLYAAVVATTVLTAQTRQNREGERRAHLELQVGLLSEQKATKVIALLEELRRDMPNVRNRHDPVAEAMQQRTEPKDVLSAIESIIDRQAAEESADSPDPAPDSPRGSA